jgi:hypothetical protein
MLTGCDEKSSDNTNAQNSASGKPQIANETSVGAPQVAQASSDLAKIGVILLLDRGFESSVGIGGFGGGGGYEYEGKIEVGNPHTTPFHFDSIEITFTDGVGGKFNRSAYPLVGETIVLTEKSIFTAYHYDGDKTVASGVRDNPDRTPTDQVLDSHQATRFRMSMAASLMPTICGKSFTMVNARIISGGKPVSEVYRAVLPPLMKIPDEFSSSEESLFELRLWPEANTPLASGVFDPAVIDRAFQKIADVSSNAVLAMITPEMMTVNTYRDESTMHLPAGWRYQFWSPDRSFSVSQVDPSAIKSSTCEKPLVALDKELLKSCVVDIDAVTMMLELVGAKSDDKDFHCRLVAMVVEGKSRPVWDVGYRLNGVKTYVFADTGQIVYEQDGGWKAFDVIWN